MSADEMVNTYPHCGATSGESTCHRPENHGGPHAFINPKLMEEMFRPAVDKGINGWWEEWHV